MPEVTGTVERVASKKLPSGMYYSFLMNDEWYRTGRTKTPVEAGYKVRFSFTDGQYGKQVDTDSLKFKEGEAPAQSSGKSGGEGGYAETQLRISFQAAFNSASNLVAEAIKNEFITFPKSAKAADKFAAYKNMVMDETINLYSVYQSVPEKSAEWLAQVAAANAPAADDIPFEEADEDGEDEWD